MNRQTLADVLQSTNQTGSYTLATVLEGAEAGSQLLLRDGDACGRPRVPNFCSVSLPSCRPVRYGLSYTGRSAGIC